MTAENKRALLVAFFLSKFDRKGVRTLGYESFEEAFIRIGLALDVKPSTVKHMRDSFDPYCSQVRVGWYQRKILPSRANVIEAYNDLSEEAMAEIVSTLLSGNAEAANAYTAPLKTTQSSAALLVENTPYATRIRTGEKAEAFFMEQFPQIAEFEGSVLEDMRKIGIGFDFRTAFPSSFYAVEVKGVTAEHGSISFTDKEWQVAAMLGNDYFLALVRALESKPKLDLICNPAQNVRVTMKSIESVSICWNAKV